MDAPRETPATYQDVLDAPEHMVAELLHGQLHLQPRPLMEHGSAATTLASDVNAAFQRARGGPGGWWIIAEPEVHLGDDVVVPDVSGWRRSRMSGPPRGAYVTLPPDWVCELLSPSTRRRDLTVKRDIYAAAGVQHLWFVDPEARTLEAFDLVEGGWHLVAAHGGNGKVRVPPFDAIEIALADLWPKAEDTSVP